MKVEMDSTGTTVLAKEVRPGQCFTWAVEGVDSPMLMVVSLASSWSLRKSLSAHKEVVEKGQILVVRLDSGAILNVDGNQAARLWSVTAKVSEYVPTPVPAKHPAYEDEEETDTAL